MYIECSHNLKQFHPTVEKSEKINTIFLSRTTQHIERDEVGKPNQKPIPKEIKFQKIHTHSLANNKRNTKAKNPK